MPKEIRARFSNGIIEPLEEVGLEEGEEITIVITKLPTGRGVIEAFRASAGAWKGTHDPDELKRSIYADRLINTRPEPKL